MLTNKSTPKPIKRQPEFPAFNISFESGIWKKQSDWDLTTIHSFFQHAADFEVLSSRSVWMRARSKIDRCCTDCHEDTIQRWVLKFAQHPEPLAFIQCQEVMQHFRILYLQCLFLPERSLSEESFEEYYNKNGSDFYLQSLNLFISTAFLLRDADLIYFVPQGTHSLMDKLNCGKLHEFWVPCPLFSKSGPFKSIMVKEISSEEWFKRPEFELEKEKLKNLLRRKKAKQAKKIHPIRKKSKAGLLSRIFFPK